MISFVWSLPKKCLFFVYVELNFNFSQVVNLMEMLLVTFVVKYLVFKVIII